MMKALDVCESLKMDFDVEYDELGSIGKRYIGCDKVGVPLCITVDHQTIGDGAVTIGLRDSAHQIRVEFKRFEKSAKRSFSLPRDS